jgi:hypothetical protein
MTRLTTTGATRRHVLGAGFAAGAVLAAGASRGAPPVPDLATPTGRLRAFMLMRAALDDRLVIGFISGRYYGVVDEEIKPLYGVLGATFSRYRPRADGGYDGASYEIPYFTDLDSGEPLKTFLNPYTGQTVEVVNSGFPPARFIVTKDLEIVTPRLPPGIEAKDRVIAVQTSGPDVWMTEETTSAFKSPGAPKPVRYSEATSLHALSRDLANPDARSVRCQTAYTSVVSWRPFLNMGDHPGHLMGNGVGRYGVPSLQDLPEKWREATARLHPDVLQDPGRPLMAIL